MRYLKYLKIVPWIIMGLSALFLTIAIIKLSIFSTIFWGLVFVFGGVKGLGYYDKLVEMLKIKEENWIKFLRESEEMSKLDKERIDKLNAERKKLREEAEKKKIEDLKKLKEEQERLFEQMRKDGIDSGDYDFNTIKLSYGMANEKQAKKEYTVSSDSFDPNYIDAKLNIAFDKMDKTFDQMDKQFEQADEQMENANKLMDDSSDKVDKMMKKLTELMDSGNVKDNASLKELLIKINRRK